MRPAPSLSLILGSLLLARLAGAVCPPDCVPGGGPAATDCIIEWGGIAGAGTTCVDGSACDQDGIADGVCTFPLQACFDVGGACGSTAMTSVRVTPRKVAAGATLASAMETLTPGQCTAPGFAVPVKPSNGMTPIKPGVAKIKVVAVADGKKDPDKLSLSCSPAAPSFANDVQPIFTQRCATPACHDASSHQENQILEVGAAYDNIVGKPSAEGGKLLVVAPGSIARSFLARKITAKGLKLANGSLMPQGCPLAPGIGGCLTDTEIYTILAWIQAGAPNN
jgi:hypothetical protein